MDKDKSLKYDTPRAGRKLAAISIVAVVVFLAGLVAGSILSDSGTTAQSQDNDTASSGSTVELSSEALTGQDGVADPDYVSYPEFIETEETDGSVCGLSAGNQEIPTKTIESALITANNERIELASYEGFGPGVTDETITYCFAHNPTGAVLAASNFWNWYTSQQNYLEAIKQLTVPNAIQTQLLAVLEEEWDGSSGSPVEIRGFQVVDYTDEVAEISLAFSLSKYEFDYYSVPIYLVWVDGDWKVDLPTEWDVQAVTSLAQGGFIAWTA